MGKCEGRMIHGDSKYGNFLVMTAMVNWSGEIGFWTWVKLDCYAAFGQSYMNGCCQRVWGIWVGFCHGFVTFNSINLLLNIYQEIESLFQNKWRRFL